MNNQETTDYLQSNASNYTTESALQIRLDTEQLKRRIEEYVTGQIRYVAEDENGNTKIIIEKTGKAKANKEGVQSILSYVHGLLNSQTVQGNFSREHFEYYMERVHINLSTNLMINMYKWGIDEEDYSAIVSNIMDMFEPFMSRLIDNKERESYADTIKTVESTRLDQAPEKKRFGIF